MVVTTTLAMINQAPVETNIGSKIVGESSILWKRQGDVWSWQVVLKRSLLRCQSNVLIDFLTIRNYSNTGINKNIQIH